MTLAAAVNPFVLFLCATLVIQGNCVYLLDLAAKLDATAEFLCKRHWGDLEFPPPFGRDALPEVKCAKRQSIDKSLPHCLPFSQEAYIAELDAKSGASLKLTILNPNGRIWTMVAGGGASVIYRYAPPPPPSPRQLVVAVL